MKANDAIGKTLLLATATVLLAAGHVAAQGHGTASGAVAQSATPHAGGGDTGRSDDARARRLFQAGEAAYADGHFDVAYAQFRQSYELSHRATLLYNVATALDRLGRPRDAADYYQRYLDQVPDAANGAFVAGRLAVIRRQLVARVGSAGGADAPDHAAGSTARGGTHTGGSAGDSADAARAGDGSAEQSGGDHHVAAHRAAMSDPRHAAGGVPIGSVVAFSLAGASAIAAVVTGLTARSAYGDLKTTCPNGSCPQSVRPTYDRLKTFTLATDVLLGAAVVSAGVGALLLVLRGHGDDRDRSGATATASCGPTGCGVAVRGRF